jgi:hypothetical protein
VEFYELGTPLSDVFYLSSWHGKCRLRLCRQELMTMLTLIRLYFV